MLTLTFLEEEAFWREAEEGNKKIKIKTGID